jgi:hypothetical protein
MLRFYFCVVVCRVVLAAGVVPVLVGYLVFLRVAGAAVVV